MNKRRKENLQCLDEDIKVKIDEDEDDRERKY